MIYGEEISLKLFSYYAIMYLVWTFVLYLVTGIGKAYFVT